MQTKTATFTAIYFDYAQKDAQAFISTLGEKLQLVSLHIEMNPADKDGFNDWTATVSYREVGAIVTVADITSQAAEYFAANRKSANSTQVWLTKAQAETLRQMCVAAGLRRNKAREFQMAGKMYDNVATGSGTEFAYYFPCPKAKHCFLLTDSDASDRAINTGILYGTDYGHQADVTPLND